MFKFGVTPVFQANYEAQEDIVINQGGTDSSKTFSILQVLCVFASCTYPPLVDPIITVLSESVPNAKKGAWRTLKTIIGDDEFAKQISYVNEGDRIIHFKTGWVIESVGATDIQNAKQGKRQYLYVNEADGITWEIFWQMAKRTRVRVFVDYNPTAPFWAHEKLIGTDPSTNDLSATVKLIISDHRHNTFLSEKDHERTEGIKDPELFKVYARGLTGNLSGLIYKTWQEIDDKDYPWDEDGKFAGQDFGYTNDPSAGVRMVKVGRNIFLHELCYEAGISPRQLKMIYKANKFTSQTPIYCDHDDDMVTQLRRLDLMAIPARKGPNTIRAGILMVNEYNVFFTRSSRNIKFERDKYMWLKDEKTGKFLNEPIDQFNHLMDAVRYGVYSRYYRVSR